MILMSCIQKPDSESNEALSDELNNTAEVAIHSDSLASDENFDYVYDEKGFQNISFTAYVQDPDKSSPTHIREKPGGIVLVPLEPGQDYMVDIIGQKNGWFRINMVHCIDPMNAVDIPGQYGWIHHSVLAVSTSNYGNQKLNVYEHPNISTRVTGVILIETEVRFTKIYKDFVLIRYTDSNGKVVTGWIEMKWLCGNPVTNCC